MLIGVSGSHCSGKTTLIDAFCDRHVDYTRLAEPYEELEEVWSEVSSDGFLAQLEFQIEQLDSLSSDRVIVERTPLDFIAYLQALNELGRSSLNHGPYLEAARTATKRFDLIVFVPTDDASIYVPEDEDRELREAVNEKLRSLVMDNELGVNAIEVFGTTAERLGMLALLLK